MSPSDAAYDFYPCLVDGAPASVYVDLRFEDAPLPAGADTRYWLAIAMRDAGPHGIGTGDEAAVLDRAEEAIARALAERGVTYVGRVRTGGSWEATFYGPPGHTDSLRAAASRARLDDRRVETGAEHDPDWRYCRELLLPDAERKRWMDDRRLVQVLREHGDLLAEPRRVDHRATFSTASARDAFVAEAARAGFTAGAVTDARVARVSREDPIELDHIHEVVMILVDAATAHGGHYDGWTAGITA